jgi:pimeloyl-ACP methyl ester carboxylesterase
MAGHNWPPSYNRTHIVLIPGFGGFDALGKVEYYAGLTPLFDDWKNDRKKSVKPAVVLHYFDNLPCAAVVTRASRLRSYVAKRIARGEILEDDAVILVGHSTGGLDIRQLISDLHRPENDPVHVDGGKDIPIATIRHCVRGIVFLSVPHWGTNIADWVRSYPVWRKAVISQLRAGAAGAEFFPLDWIQPRLAAGAACITGADLLLAVEDALTEANARHGKPSPQRTADAHEAASDLGLYLRHMASDFHVIDDLASKRPEEGPLSPAHYDMARRSKELKRWTWPTRSYVTIADPPFRFPPGAPAPVWSLADLSTYPEISKDAQMSAGTDMFYRMCYRACAGGPFRRPRLAGKVTRTLDGAPPPPIEVWDNDGIVNTASMLWPKGEIVLVPCDHLDIVGHYTLVEAERGGGRRYRVYDALESMPRFTAAAFKQVWTEVFDFCVCPTAAGPPLKQPARAAAGA